MIAQLRPMTVDDMLPGYTYDANAMILVVETLPLMGSDGKRRRHGYQAVVDMPPEYREPNHFNTRLALDLLCETHPEAKKSIERLKRLARSPESRKQARDIGMTDKHYAPEEAAKAFPWLSS